MPLTMSWEFDAYVTAALTVLRAYIVAEDRVDEDRTVPGAADGAVRADGPLGVIGRRSVCDSRAWV